MVKLKKPLEKDVYPVPERIDKMIAKEKLAAMGVTIDRLTAEQKQYLASWQLGT
jgi:adenosylhomocysteinase